MRSSPETICARSIDRKLEAMIQEKGDASELVLDGHLIGEQTTDVNLAELLDIARKEFAGAGESSSSSSSSSLLTFVDERVPETEWPALRSELSVTACAWRLKGLELLGVPPTAFIALDLPKASLRAPRSASTCLPGRSSRAKAGPPATRSKSWKSSVTTSTCSPVSRCSNSPELSTLNYQPSTASE